MKKLLIITLLLGSVLLANQGFNMPSFSYFDTNIDGKISEKELNDGRVKRHNELAQEGRMLRNTKNAPSFSQLDTDNDGYISKVEFASHQNAMKAK
ncbi:MAG: hypothetical protein COA44_05665 [Arcobacter sp.]|nr:MAG: hypothetical protein COA44_05665 [Arcobacter sp.]